jgi:hypothetical protein
VKIHLGHIMKKNGDEVVGRFGENHRNARHPSRPAVAQ